MFGLTIKENDMNIKLKSKAFTLIECLVSLWITLIVGFLLFGILNQMIKYHRLLNDDTFARWQVGMIQVQKVLEHKKLEEVSGDKIVIGENGEKTILRVYKDQLVESKLNQENKVKGYKPLIFGLKKFQFKQEENNIVFQGEFENEKTYEYMYPIQKASG